MYLINLTIKESSDARQAAQHLVAHRAWYTKYFNQGNFKLVGPSKTFDRAGVIIAQASNRSALSRILAQDAYYPDLADYRVEEFAAKMIAENITIEKN